jgi:hypothetical protein
MQRTVESCWLCCQNYLPPLIWVVSPLFPLVWTGVAEFKDESLGSGIAEEPTKSPTSEGL